MKKGIDKLKKIWYNKYIIKKGKDGEVQKGKS